VNRALRRISIAVLVMFVLLLINDNYLQGFEAASLATKPGNSRAFYAAQNQYERGSILTSDGLTIAASRLSGPNDVIKYQRYYPKGAEYAPVTGYDTLYSQTGIEQAENPLLSGNDSALDVRKIIDLITGKTTRGANVTVTINSAAQNAAWNALATLTQGKPGAVVALNPSTGAILAMASYPSYNPDLLAVHDGNKLIANDNALLKAPGNPLLNRAINSSFPPGSTFKIVTSSAYLSRTAGSSTQSSVYSPTVLTLPNGNSLHNNDGEACSVGTGHTTLITAFAESCDTTFANLGVQLGSAAIRNYADLFGMNDQNLTIPLLASPSNYPPLTDKSLTALSAIGQYNDTVTPLQEAMLSAAIANHGALMRPYLVQQITASDLSTVQTTTPTMLQQAVSPTVASEVGQMMLAVVQDSDGTGYQFNQNTEGVAIAGKTGTAQNGVNNSAASDSVFTCFAPFDNPQIAVGVIVQGGGYGATVAAPIAVSVIKAYLAYLRTK
jgi:peptidoglycan glycosyltransferase